MESSLPKPYSLKKLSGFVGDDPKQVVEMIGLFIETIPPELDFLQEYAAAQEMEQVATVAHRIKPSLDVFDLQYAMQIIRTIELFCKDSIKHKEVPALVRDLRQNLFAALEVMKTEMS